MTKIFNLDVNEVQLGFRLTKFRSNGKRFRFRRFFYETKERVVAYTVMVPVKEGDVIKMVPEQRTRTAVIAVPNVKDALLDTTANLETLDGKKLQHDDVAKRFSGKEVTIVVIPKEANISDDWKEVLRRDVVVLRDDGKVIPAFARPPEPVLPEGDVPALIEKDPI